MATVLVTGGSRGIGRGICEAFLSRGDNVAYTCHNVETLEDSRKRFQKLSNENTFLGLMCNSGEYTQVSETVDKVFEMFSGIDILVNNAGIRKYGTIYDISIEEWNEAVATNVNGYFYFCKCTLPYLLKSKDPWIFNIGSTAANSPFSGGISYNTTKAAVHGFSSSLQLDVRNDGIRVCNIVPGNVYNKDIPCQEEDEWMMKPIDIGNCIISLLQLDQRAMTSVVEIKPTNAPKHPEPGIRALRFV